MRILLVCTALCASWPASLWASTEFLPTETSFAYAGRHGATALPDSAFTALRPAENDDGGLGEMGGEPAPIMPTPKIPRVFSRNELCTAAASAAEANNLPVPFFTNLIQQESGFKPHAVSPAGAQGIAQFMPRVAAAYGLTNPFDPIHALAVSAKFLRELLQQFGNIGLAAAAYNGGSGRVGDWLAKKKRLPSETRNYVQAITGRPAEQWVRGKGKVQAQAGGEELRLPAHARCPGLNVMVARAAQPVRPVVKVASADAPAEATSFALAAAPLAKRSRAVSVGHAGKPHAVASLSPAKKSLIIIAAEHPAKKPVVAAARTRPGTGADAVRGHGRTKMAAASHKPEPRTAAGVKLAAAKPAEHRQAANKRVKVAAAR